MSDYAESTRRVYRYRGVSWHVWTCEHSRAPYLYVQHPDGAPRGCPLSALNDMHGPFKMHMLIRRECSEILESLRWRERPIRARAAAERFLERLPAVGSGE